MEDGDPYCETGMYLSKSGNINVKYCSLRYRVVHNRLSIWERLNVRVGVPFMFYVLTPYVVHSRSPFNLKYTIRELERMYVHCVYIIYAIRYLPISSRQTFRWFSYENLI